MWYFIAKNTLLFTLLYVRALFIFRWRCPILPWIRLLQSSTPGWGISGVIIAEDHPSTFYRSGRRTCRRRTSRITAVHVSIIRKQWHGIPLIPTHNDQCWLKGGATLTMVAHLCSSIGSTYFDCCSAMTDLDMRRCYYNAGKADRQTIKETYILLSRQTYLS